jgi:hypothetical protein
MSLYQLLAIELTWSYTSWILCELGIKNRDDVEKMFELYESFGIEGIYDGDNAENGSWWINFFSALYNLSLILGDGFWSLIDQPCRSDNSIPKTLKNISNQLSSDTPYISDVKKVIDDLSSFLTIDLDTSTLEKNLNSEDIINSDKEDEKPKYGTIKKR